MKVLVVTNMYPIPGQPAFGTFVEDQVSALRRAGVEIDVFFVNGRKNKLNYFWALFRFWWVLLKKRYDLIHAHYAISGFLARLQFVCPVVVTYHGGEVLDYVSWWLKVLARRGTLIFDRIITVNRREKAILHNDPKVRVIPCGVYLDEFKPTPRDAARVQLGLPKDKPLILWAGEYFQPEKNFSLAEESVQLLKRHRPDAELILVSGKPHSVIPTYMNACDVLVLTSYSEGSPMVVKEAMSCNLPIVSTDVGDVAELIGGVQNCYLVKSSAGDVAEKLEQALRCGQRTNGRECITHLSSASIAGRIIAVFNEVCPPERRIALADPTSEEIRRCDANVAECATSVV